MATHKIMKVAFVITALLWPWPLDALAKGSADRHVYFGELHDHSSWSKDAYVFGTRLGPEVAVKCACGDAVLHPGGFTVQLKQPLDFSIVMDHSEYLGALAMADDPSPPMRKNSPILADTLRRQLLSPHLLLIHFLDEF